MKSGNSKFLSILLFLCCATPIAAQQPIFRASVSDTKVEENGIFDIRFQLADAEGANFQPPSFADFTVVGGPARGSSTTIINGVVNTSQSWSYSLLARKKGTFTIGPATIVAGRKKLSTNLVTIQVVEAREIAGSHGDATTEDDIILLAEVPEQNFYPGQQIILQYRLLYRDNIETIGALAEDDYKEFFLQKLEQYDKQPSIVRYNGKEYTSSIIKMVSLYAHQSGVYTIDPMIVSAGVNAPQPGMQGFFTMRRIRDVQVRSNPLRIEVKPIPGTEPKNYTGAVGIYSIVTESTKTQVNAGEAIAFQIEITGDGDSRRWDVPMPVTSDSAELYPPRIMTDEVKEAEGKIQHKRRLAYQVVPQNPGEFYVYVPFVVFNPDSNRFQTIASDTIRVLVASGTGRKQIVQADSSALPMTLRKVRSSVLPDTFWRSPIHLSLAGLLMGLTITGWWTWRSRKKGASIPLQDRLRDQAGIHALSSIDAFEARFREGRVNREWYQDIGEMYFRFLRDRFSIAPEELDPEHIREKLSRNSFPTELQAEAIDFFDACQQIRYSGFIAGVQADQLIAHCRELIRKLT